MNLIKQGLAVQKQIVEANSNVIDRWTFEAARKLRDQGKVLVHKPTAEHCAFDGDDFPPEAA